MADQYISKIIQSITENTNTTTNLGIIIASPSDDPPYKYHWIRDSALVMRTIVDMYNVTKDPVYFQSIINYIENESKIQKLETKTGLGEPKYNINCTAYNGPWGRPQNDGPALRGIILFQLIDLIYYKYETLIHQLILPIIQKDLEYILNNYRKVSYDIWEENKGWHFYTRMVQAKFIKIYEQEGCDPHAHHEGGVGELRPRQGVQVSDGRVQQLVGDHRRLLRPRRAQGSGPHRERDEQH